MALAWLTLQIHSCLSTKRGEIFGGRPFARHASRANDGPSPDLPTIEPNAYYCAAATLLAGASLMQIEILRSERKLEAHAATGLQVHVARALALLGASGKDPRDPSPAVADALGQVLVQVGRAHAAPEPPNTAEAFASTIRAVIPGPK